MARLEADKTTRQVRAYDADDVLIAAYPATIGSEVQSVAERDACGRRRRADARTTPTIRT